MPKQEGGELGFKKTYKMTGKAEASAAGSTKVTDIDKGAAGSHRDNNWKKSAAQAKLKNAGKIGPGKNLNEIDGGNFY